MILKRNYIPAFPDENLESQLIKTFYQNSTFSILINKRISTQDHAIQCRIIPRNSPRGHVGGWQISRGFDQAEHKLAVTFVLEE